MITLASHFMFEFSLKIHSKGYSAPIDTSEKPLPKYIQERGPQGRTMQSACILPCFLFKHYEFNNMKFYTECHNTTTRRLPWRASFKLLKSSYSHFDSSNRRCNENVKRGC